MPNGGYELRIAKALAPGEAAELRPQGNPDTLGDYILWHRVRYSVVTLLAESFEGVFRVKEPIKRNPFLHLIFLTVQKARA